MREGTKGNSGGGGGGGFFLTCEDLRGMFNHSFPACVFCIFKCFLLFFSVEISLRTLMPLFRPGMVHGGSAR